MYRRIQHVKYAFHFEGIFLKYAYAKKIQSNMYHFSDDILAKVQSDYSL
jgi:hypothetical protein